MQNVAVNCSSGVKCSRMHDSERSFLPIYIFYFVFCILCFVFCVLYFVFAFVSFILYGSILHGGSEGSVLLPALVT